MKKLYTTILIIAVILFISCDEQKAKNDITKAIEKTKDETEDVANKNTPKPKGSGTLTNTEGEDAEGEADSNPKESGGGGTPPPPAPTLTKPVLSKIATWETVIRFPKAVRHTYALKEAKTGVTLSETTGNRMQVTATQSAQNVIIVATLDGTTSESNPIEFTRIPGNTLSFTDETRTERRRATFTQAASKSGTVAGDTRNIKYSVSPTGTGIIIDSSSGEVRVSDKADTGVYTITAELQQNAKYERSTAEYTLTVPQPSPPRPATKPVLSSERAPWNTVITFPKAAEHTYALKEAKTGVVLSETEDNRMEVIATQSAQDVIVVATLDGTIIESNPIEFTRIPGNTLSFIDETRTENPDIIASIDPTITKSGTVPGDTRNIKYSVSPTGAGITIDSSSGVVTIARDATERDYIITAELQQNAQYERSTATYTLTISKE